MSIVFGRGGQTFWLTGQIHKIKSAQAAHKFLLILKLKKDLLSMFSYKIVFKS